MFDAVIFDLDGTLWDTSAACAVAWNNVLKRRHISFRAITADDVRKVTGMPHDVCIRETFAGLPEETLQVLIEDTIFEDNLVVAERGGEIYVGVAEGVLKLKEQYPLFIVSNCQSGYIETFLQFSGYAHLFSDFECWGNTGLSKSENLKSLMERNSLKNSVYIGDAEGDRKAARDCGIQFYFAKYGFGAVQDYDFKFPSFEALIQKLLRKVS